MTCRSSAWCFPSTVIALFSAPMDWAGIVDQLEKSAEEGPLISLPVQGAVLAARVRVSIAAGLVDLNKLLRQATVRRNVVTQLIRMRKDAGHPDYQHVNMEDVRRRSRELATTYNPFTSPLSARSWGGGANTRS